MDKTLEQLDTTAMISKMVRPIIIMNTEDYKSFVGKVERNVIGFNPSCKPTYRGIEIEVRDYAEKGHIIIYDKSSMEEQLNAVLNRP